MNHRSHTTDPASPDAEHTLPPYARLDVWVDGVPTPVFISFCDVCFALVPVVKAPQHAERHRKGLD